MSKRTRQYIGILAALAAYYLVHEGAHLLYALFTGVLKQINFMGLGVQIDVYAEHMTNMQLGIFCLVGALATFSVGYLLAALARSICHAKSKLLRAVLYYITIAFLLLDPLYLSVLCSFFGGGDMNGIALLYPEWAARCLFGALLLVNGLVFWKRVLPVYRQSFPGDELIGGTMKNYKKTITMLLTAAILLVSVFMTGCTSPTEPKNSTPSGTDASAESDSFGVYVKLERDDASSIALHGGSSFTKVCENADGSPLKAGEWVFTGDDIVQLSKKDNCSVLFTVSARDADDTLLGEGTFLYDVARESCMSPFLRTA